MLVLCLTTHLLKLVVLTFLGNISHALVLPDCLAKLLTFITVGSGVVYDGVQVLHGRIVRTQANALSLVLRVRAGAGRVPDAVDVDQPGLRPAVVHPAVDPRGALSRHTSGQEGEDSQGTQDGSHYKYAS